MTQTGDVHVDEAHVDEVHIGEVHIDEVHIDEVRIEGVRVDEDIETVESIEEKSDSRELMVLQNKEILYYSINYQKLMFVYDSAIKIMKVKLQIFSNEFQFSNDRNPIENIKSRIKSPESIARKMEKKNISFTAEDMMNNVYDIAGIRVVCPFISDVYYMADMLLKQNDITLIKRKDYITNPKANGYRSLHLIIQVDVPVSDRIQKVTIEIQIRTIAMNCWASLEHQMRYKKEYARTLEMDEELLRCANQLAATDMAMQKLASHMMPHQ